MDKAQKRAAIFYVVLLGMMVVVLRQMGRQWWCECGSWVPWSWDIWSSHNSQHLIDPYFFSHVLHGVLFYGGLHLLVPKLGSGVRLRIAVMMEVGWEILENSPLIINRYRAATISLDYFGDAIANSMFDVAACALGYWFASSVRWWWSVALIALFEIGMLLTIRDCLTLNVIMLVSPVEAIKEWQSAG